MRGLSEPNGSWKMNCSLVRKRLRSLPSMVMTSVLRPQSSNTTRPAPWLGSAEMPRISILESVVLPQPDSPTRPRHSPRITSKLTSLTARMVRVLPPPISCSSRVSALRMLKVLVRWRTLSTGACGLKVGSGSTSALPPSRCPVAAWISRIGCKRSPGFMSKRGTACSSALR